MRRRILSEFLGTAFLLMVVVGSGIMGDDLSSGNSAIALLANSLATGFGLWVLIQVLGEWSGAHFNPAVTLSEFAGGRMSLRDLAGYWLAQFGGAILGVILAHAMFNQPWIQISGRPRVGAHLQLSEAIATFGLVATVILTRGRGPNVAATAVSAYILSGYWFTSSTCFANPAATVARALTNTFCGISPMGVLPFLGAQILGALAAVFLFGRIRER